MGFCFLYTCCMQSIVFHSVWWWLWNKVENLQSHLLVLFCSYFELQDVLILRILFLFILTHLTPSFSSLLMLIHNSKSRNNSPCFKVTSLHVSHSSVTSFPPSTCKCKKLYTRKNRRTNSWPNRYKLRFFNRNSLHWKWKPDMRVHVL